MSYYQTKDHSSAVGALGLPEERARVFPALYLGWIIDKGLYSESFGKEFADEISQFKTRQLSASKICDDCDGLFEDMLNDEGIAFSDMYFDLERGLYVPDFNEVLVQGLRSEYHVEENWDDYRRIAERIDQRYSEWKRGALRKQRRTWSEWAESLRLRDFNLNAGGLLGALIGGPMVSGLLIAVGAPVELAAKALVLAIIAGAIVGNLAWGLIVRKHKRT